MMSRGRRRRGPRGGCARKDCSVNQGLSSTRGGQLASVMYTPDGVGANRLKHPGKENVLHLDIEPGTDIALFNGLLTYVVDQGWHDADFIAQHTSGFDAALEANRMTLEETGAITGISVDNLRKAAEWAYAPKASGHRKRTMHAYEKGIIWGNDNYKIQSSLVDLVLATHNKRRRYG